MEGNVFWTQGVKAANEAVVHDNNKEWKLALENYIKALDYFQSFLKFEQNQQIKDHAKPGIAKYFDRAEQLKKAIKEGASRDDSGGGGGGAGTLAKGKEDGKKEDENDKLKASLGSAILTEKPNVKWSDVAGLDVAKDTLKEAVTLPARFPQLFNEKRKPWKGILLYGPPGTGKSYLAKAVATEADAMFFNVSSSDLVSKWQGESEKLVKNLFNMARAEERAIIFIDEIDSLATSRSEGENESSRRIKTEFLVQMQGVGTGKDSLLVLGATNTPWEIDAAMRRRFEKRVYIPLPGAHARARMFKIHLGKKGHTLTANDFRALGVKSEGMSGSDINGIVRDALMEPVRKSTTAVWWKPVRDMSDGLIKYQPYAGWMVWGIEIPPCAHCPRDTWDEDVPSRTTCRNCGCMRCSLYDLKTEELMEPKVTYEDFESVMRRARATVGKDELVRFEEWTKEFGMEGS